MKSLLTMDGSNKKEFVVDSSFILAALLPDERFARIDEIIASAGSGSNIFYSSPLLTFEVANGIKLGVIRRRFNLRQAEELLENFLVLMKRISIEEVELKDVWTVAREEALTIYDATFLALVRKKKCELLSLDKDLLHFSYKIN